MYRVLVAMTDVVCGMRPYKFQGARVHYDVTTFSDVCETANGPRLLSFTTTGRSGDMEEGRWVVVDSEYHHQHLPVYSFVVDQDAMNYVFMLNVKAN